LHLQPTSKQCCTHLLYSNILILPKPQVDPESVRFKDKTREKQRQKQLKQTAAAAAAAGPDPQQQRRKGGARDKRGRGGAGAAAPEELDEKLPAAKRRQLQQRDEMAELTRDYQLLKKLKRGKISQRAFDVATGISSGSEDEFDEGGNESDAGGGKKTQKFNGQLVGAGVKKHCGEVVAAAAAAAAEGSSVSRLLAKKKKRQQKKQRKRTAEAAGGGGGGGGRD
jgi:hypothetical protein